LGGHHLPSANGGLPWHLHRPPRRMAPVGRRRSQEFRSCWPASGSVPQPGSVLSSDHAALRLCPGFGNPAKTTARKFGPAPRASRTPAPPTGNPEFLALIGAKCTRERKDAWQGGGVARRVQYLWSRIVKLPFWTSHRQGRARKDGVGRLWPVLVQSPGSFNRSLVKILAEAAEHAAETDFPFRRRPDGMRRGARGPGGSFCAAKCSRDNF
jgi:hypothetical protein